MADAFEKLAPKNPPKNKTNRGKSQKKQHKTERPDPPNIENIPFRILGISDNAACFFIGRSDRLVESTMSSINKNVLLQLAPIEWWRDSFGTDGRLNWDYPIDFIIKLAASIDFDAEKIRGRGAWIDDGNICYHDGMTTTGKFSEEKIYLRKPVKNIGIASPLPSNGTAKGIYHAVDRMSFENGIDTIRLLGWSLLAPFAGALPWRPALLLTGSSGSGKSTVIDKVVKPLALPEIFSGGATSEAGVRQRIKNDAAAIVVEESETDTPKKKGYRADLFSLMRQSTSNDAPRAAKGTRDQKGTSFKLRSMFMFAAISPEVESEADDNRIFLVNMKKTDGSGWKETEKEISKYITPRNCASIRAFMWQNLNKIISDAKEIASIIHSITRRDMRSSLADGLLFSAFFSVTETLKDSTDEQKRKVLEMFLSQDTTEPQRDEADDTVTRLLDEVVFAERPIGQRRNMTMRQVLLAGFVGFMESIDNNQGDTKVSPPDQIYFRHIAYAHGMGLDKEYNLTVASNHHKVMQIINKGRGYQRILYRHKGLVEKSRSVNMAGKSRRCIVIKNALEVPNDYRVLC